MKLAYISVPTWSISMTTIKTGICLTILRIQSTRRWKFFLYTIIVVQITYCVGNTLFAVFRGGANNTPVSVRIMSPLPRSWEAPSTLQRTSSWR
jgi:hypothetical protein